jgi:hypothetical protein
MKSDQAPMRGLQVWEALAPALLMKFLRQSLAIPQARLIPIPNLSAQKEKDALTTPQTQKKVVPRR